MLDTLKSSQVPAFLVRKLFQQLFSFLNVQLFNQLLLRRECCSFSNGEFVKTGLGEVEQWIHAADSHWVGESWEQLKNIRQVAPLNFSFFCYWDFVCFILYWDFAVIKFQRGGGGPMLPLTYHL